MLDETTFAAAVDELCAADPDLAAIVERHGLPPFWAREPGLGTLVLLILEQQVSLASARAAYGRLTARLGELTPLSPRAQRLREIVALLDARDRVSEPELAVFSTRWRDHLRELKRRGWVTRTGSRIAATPLDTYHGAQQTPARYI